MHFTSDNQLVPVQGRILDFVEWILLLRKSKQIRRPYIFTLSNVRCLYWLFKRLHGAVHGIQFPVEGELKKHTPNINYSFFSWNFLWGFSITFACAASSIKKYQFHFKLPTNHFPQNDRMASAYEFRCNGTWYLVGHERNIQTITAVLPVRNLMHLFKL